MLVLSSACSVDNLKFLLLFREIGSQKSAISPKLEQIIPHPLRPPNVRRPHCRMTWSYDHPQILQVGGHTGMGGMKFMAEKPLNAAIYGPYVRNHFHSLLIRALRRVVTRDRLKVTARRLSLSSGREGRRSRGEGPQGPRQEGLPPPLSVDMFPSFPPGEGCQQAQVPDGQFPHPRARIKAFKHPPLRKCAQCIG